VCTNSGPAERTILPVARRETSVGKYRLCSVGYECYSANFVNELPHTAVGKLHKLKLREQFCDYVLPSSLEVENCPLAQERATGDAGSKPAAQ
jgi:hypothetical protein